jgi:hypothetical protein
MFPRSLCARFLKVFDWKDRKGSANALASAREDRARSVPRNGARALCFYVCFPPRCQPAAMIKNDGCGNSLLLKVLHRPRPFHLRLRVHRSMPGNVQAVVL